MINNEIDVPPEIYEEHSNLELCMDVMLVNRQPMLTTIDRSIKFRGLVPLNSRKKNELYRALDVILRHYNKSGFKVTKIHCDNEFRTLMEEIQDELDIELNFANAGDHVPEAERDNRTIKERIRAAYHHLPYKALPKIMIRYLAMTSASKLNLFPVKGGVSKYYSPNVIMSQRSLNYEKDCAHPYGAYVQANNNNDPTNTHVPRTLDAVYLRPARNVQ